MAAYSNQRVAAIIIKILYRKLTVLLTEYKYKKENQPPSPHNFPFTVQKMTVFLKLMTAFCLKHDRVF